MIAWDGRFRVLMAKLAQYLPKCSGGLHWADPTQSIQWTVRCTLCSHWVSVNFILRMIILWSLRAIALPDSRPVGEPGRSSQTSLIRSFCSLSRLQVRLNHLNRPWSSSANFTNLPGCKLKQQPNLFALELVNQTRFIFIASLCISNTRNSNNWLIRMSNRIRKSLKLCAILMPVMLTNAADWSVQLQLGSSRDSLSEFRCRNPDRAWSGC